MLKTFFFHPHVTTTFRGQQITRRATVAGEFNPSTQELRLGLSVCSEKDQFRKKYGCASALGKARSKSPADIILINPALSNTAKELNGYFVGRAIELLEANNYLVVSPQTEEENATVTGE